MSGGHEAKWDRLCAFASDLVQQKGVPGFSVGILYQGEVAAAGFGVTSVENPLDVTDETLFQIGSISKTFTSTILMRLMEAGKVDLDATVRSYLPDFKVKDESASAQATLRHLLTHMSGWVGDLFIDTGWGDDALPKYVAKMAELEQLAPLGTVWSYNNAGFVVMGAIIERVTGQPYAAVLKEMLLEPLGLEHAFLFPGDVMTHRFATGHYPTPEGPVVARPWALPHCVGPAGGIICHVKDLLGYARFHLGDGCTPNGERLLAAETLAQMHTPEVTVWDTACWGLGWSVDEVDGQRRISHGGGTVGQSSVLALIPAQDFAIAVLTNSDNGGEVIQALTRYALQEYLGLEETDADPIEASETDLAAYAGHYSRPYMDIDLGMLGGRLIAQLTFKGSFPTEEAPVPPTPPPASLALCEPDRLLVMDGVMKGAKIDVVRKADGSIGWIRAGGRILIRQD